MPGPRSEYSSKQKLLIQKLRQEKLAWPKVRQIFNEAYPLEKRSEDALRKVHSRTLSSPTPSSKSAMSSRKIEFAAIHTLDRPPPLRRRWHDQTPTPTEPPVKKPEMEEIDKNLQEMQEILRLHENKIAIAKHAYCVTQGEAPRATEEEK